METLRQPLMTTVFKWGDKETAYKTLNGTYFSIDAPDEVCRVLERARIHNERIRIFNGDTDTGRAWQEEFDVSGRVSCSMGPLKTSLLIHSRRSIGGMAICTNSVVGILGNNKQWLYKHPSLELGRWRIESSQGRFNVCLNDETLYHAAFDSEKQAARYVEFMTGKRLCK